jgi:hypothetical protein
MNTANTSKQSRVGTVLQTIEEVLRHRRTEFLDPRCLGGAILRAEERRAGGLSLEMKVSALSIAGAFAPCGGRTSFVRLRVGHA